MRAAVMQILFLPLVVALAMLSGRAANASTHDFYTGKTVRFIAGSLPGTGHDLYARAIARHFGKHLPGKPRVLVQNIVGAGGVLALNHMYNVVKPDGLTVANFPGGNILLELTKEPGVQFQSTKLSWLGSANSEVAVCIARHDMGVKSVADVTRTAKPLVLGAGGPGSTLALHPEAMNVVLGTNFKVIAGYKGVGEIYTALERREIDGVCGNLWSTLKSGRPEWVPKGYVNVFIQTGLDKHPELREIPWIMDMVKKPEDRQFLEVLFAPMRMGRPFAAPPGTPAERLRLLRAAFLETLKDPAFREEARRMQLEVEIVSTGEEVQNLIQRVFAVPSQIIDRIAKLLKG
jgi:tripartite-type tricarboxylate transporter receptor subunit TctC